MRLVAEYPGALEGRALVRGLSNSRCWMLTKACVLGMPDITKETVRAVGRDMECFMGFGGVQKVSITIVSNCCRGRVVPPCHAKNASTAWDLPIPSTKILG